MGKCVAVIDYGLGNLRSVAKALETVGARVKVTNEAKSISNATAIVLPGVGAFGRAMDNLNKLDITPSILAAVKEGKPFLGICLGLQVLFTQSQEHGECKGLGILKGSVEKFTSGVKIPHMGWNEVQFSTDNARLAIFKDIPDKSYFYFVHSYYVEPLEKGIVAATANYGREFTSAVNKDNLWGVQFHPEKSAKLGLKILDNFINL